MPRRESSVAPGWWDYTTLDEKLLADAAALTPQQLFGLSRPGFKVVVYDTLEDFYLAESLEYIAAWKQSTADNPVGICGPIGPTEQLPLVARLVNELGLDVRSGHFWGMDEWFLDGREAPPSHPLSFERADRELELGGMLASNYDLALDPDIAVRILVRGMEEGWFTGKSLASYIAPGLGTHGEFVNARRIINGNDRAEMIARYADQFKDALIAGGWA